MTFYLLSPCLRSWKQRLSAKLRDDRSQVPTEESCPSKPPSSVQDTFTVLIQWNVVCYIILNQVSGQQQRWHSAQGKFSVGGWPAHHRMFSSFPTSATRCQQCPLPSCLNKDVTRCPWVANGCSWLTHLSLLDCARQWALTAGRHGAVQYGARLCFYWQRLRHSLVIVKLEMTNARQIKLRSIESLRPVKWCSCYLLTWRDIPVLF